MFGLFSSKTKKIEEKLSNLAIEIASIQKNIIIYPNENNYKNLHMSKTKELNSLYNELEAAKGKDYLNEFISKLSKEYKKSEYVLSKAEQKILDKILIEYKVKVKIKAQLISKILSISTQAFKGRELQPIAILECKFTEKIFVIKSDAPLITFAWSEKLSKQFT